MQAVFGQPLAAKGPKGGYDFHFEPLEEEEEEDVPRGFNRRSRPRYICRVTGESHKIGGAEAEEAEAMLKQTKQLQVHVLFSI